MKRGFQIIIHFLLIILNIKTPPSLSQEIPSSPNFEENIMKINAIKEILNCIAGQNNNNYSEKLISFAKETKDITQNFSFEELDSLAKSINDIDLIIECKRKGFYKIYPSAKAIELYSHSVLAEKLIKRNYIIKSFQSRGITNIYKAANMTLY